jgi:hypothetical protein
LVTYSFKPRFVDPIRWGLGLGLDVADATLSIGEPKRQTIRAVGKKRHARVGETLQLYTGMRTKQCRQIGTARCVSVDPIVIRFFKHQHSDRVRIGEPSVKVLVLDRPHRLDAFAKEDGFHSWGHLREFWRQEHPDVDNLFEGLIIKWEPIT